MTLQQLIDQAMTNQAFSNAYTYWTVTRNKQPDLDWLMEQLEATLGKDYVAAAAQSHIEECDYDYAPIPE